MVELISREEVLRTIRYDTPNTNPDFYNLRSKSGYGAWMHSNGEACAQVRIQARVEKLNVIEAERVVRHGHWKDNGNGTVTCSRCATWFQKEQEPYLLYCGYCGAMMDGEET